MNLPHLGYDYRDLCDLGAEFTAPEIEGQPKVWLKTWQILNKRKKEISDFLNPLFSIHNLEIILTGAGTSAFVGESLQGPFQKNSGVRTRAVSTTDLVTHPDLFIRPDNPLLLISFARSGNSPESVEAVNVANKSCKQIYHFIITCNPDGELAQKKIHENSFVFFTPPEADDKGLAMTGSFTSMLLTGILISQINALGSLENQISALVRYGDKILKDYLSVLKDSARLDFERAVFLGSGPLLGIARECHLKLQELTAGKVICKHDSFLGFRHGPKAVMNEKTLVVFLFSNNKHSIKYEKDLLNAVNSSEKGLYRIGIMETDIDGIDVDLKIVLSENENLKEEFLSVCSVLPAQMIGMFKSINLGLKPDVPSESGTITRVVEGVNIYPYE